MKTNRAAIYARKSTEQNVSDDAKSVARQAELGRAFAAKHGWTVADEHVYVDDGVSGAEFEDRPGLAKLVMAAKAPARAFDVLVTMDQDRIGRDQIRTPMVLNDLIEAGVRVFYYATGQELRLESPTDKLLANVVNFGNEWYRHQVRVKTREAMRSKAAHGYVAGGKVYGYTNVREGAHVHRVINEQEAKVICRVFKMAADGFGLLRIAKALNAEGVRSPKGDGWASTSVREMLRRDLYRGRIVYGKTKWQDRRGTKVKVDVPETDWLVLEQPALAIVPPALWDAAHARMTRTRQTYSGSRATLGRFEGRPEAGLTSRHLLSGFLRCGVCGGSMFVAPRSGARGKTRLYYVCTTHHKRGNTRCTNRHGVPYEALTQSVLGQFKREFLSPVVLGKLLTSEIARREANPDETKTRREEAEAELKKVDQELARLAEAVAAGGEMRALVDAMTTKQRQRDTLAAQIEHLDGLAQEDADWDVSAWLEESQELLCDLQGTLEADPVAGRGVLRSLLVSPITVTPVKTDSGLVFEYLGQGAFDRVLAGRTADAKTVRKRNTTVLVPPG